MQGGQGPGPSIYIARRIVAGVVVLLVLALVGIWAWQSFLKPNPQSASEAPESTSVSSSSTEETVIGEGSAMSPEESVASKEAPEKKPQASTQGSTESPEVVSLAPAPVASASEAPEVLPPVASPVNTSPPEEITPPPISNAPPSLPLPAPASPPPSPPATVGNQPMNQATQVPSTGAPVPPNLPTIPQQQVVQPATLEELVPFMKQASFQEQSPFGEPALAEQALFESPPLEAGTSANVSVTVGNTVATASRGAIARAGGVTAMAG
jgi:hypothetical protein